MESKNFEGYQGSIQKILSLLNTEFVEILALRHFIKIIKLFYLLFKLNYLIEIKEALQVPK